MLVGRWVGIEGTMATSSYPQKSEELFGLALLENPAAGEASLYQRISGSSYQTTEEYIFLTTPGAIGVLDYSGSLGFVFGGMSVLTGLLIVIELAAVRLVRSAFVVSIGLLALANGIAQMNFPYLFFVLCVEQCFAFVAFALVNASWRPDHQVRSGQVVRT